MSQMHSVADLAENEIDRLYKSLRLSGDTATSIAAKLGMHRNSINGYLHGKPMDHRTKIAWAFATGVTVKWLETGQTQGHNGPEPDPSLPRLDSNQQPSGYALSLVAA